MQSHMVTASESSFDDARSLPDRVNVEEIEDSLYDSISQLCTPLEEDVFTRSLTAEAWLSPALTSIP